MQWNTNRLLVALLLLAVVSLLAVPTLRHDHAGGNASHSHWNGRPHASSRRASSWRQSLTAWCGPNHPLSSTAVSCVLPIRTCTSASCGSNGRSQRRTIQQRCPEMPSSACRSRQRLTTVAATCSRGFPWGSGARSRHGQNSTVLLARLRVWTTRTSCFRIALTTNHRSRHRNRSLWRRVVWRSVLSHPEILTRAFVNAALSSAASA